MNDINELRSALFDTLRALRSGAIDIDRASAINDTAQTIINSAKVEIDHMKLVGGSSGFIVGASVPQIQGKTTRTSSGTKTVTQLPGGYITQHRMS